MITEDQLEQLAIQWFQDTGWNYLHGAVIAPEGVAAEREDFRAVVLKGRLEEAVRRLNPKLPESAVEEVRRRVAMPGQVVHVVTKPEHPSLVQSKERRYPIALTMRGGMGKRFAAVHGLSMDIGGRIPSLLEWDAPLGRKNEDEILINYQI